MVGRGWGHGNPTDDTPDDRATNVAATPGGLNRTVLTTAAVTKAAAALIDVAVLVISGRSSHRAGRRSRERRQFDGATQGTSRFVVD